MRICDECFGDGYVCDESDPGSATAKECPNCRGSGEIEGEYNDADSAE